MNPSTNLQLMLALHLCGSGRPCPHHLKEAVELETKILAQQKYDREQEATQALDRLAAKKVAT